MERGLVLILGFLCVLRSKPSVSNNYFVLRGFMRRFRKKALSAAISSTVALMSIGSSAFAQEDIIEEVS